jgi:hypothetical protein
VHAVGTCRTLSPGHRIGTFSWLEAHESHSRQAVDCRSYGDERLCREWWAGNAPPGAGEHVVLVPCADLSSHSCGVVSEPRHLAGCSGPGERGGRPVGQGGLRRSVRVGVAPHRAEPGRCGLPSRPWRRAGCAERTRTGALRSGCNGGCHRADARDLRPSAGRCGLALVKASLHVPQHEPALALAQPDRSQVDRPPAPAVVFSHPGDVDEPKPSFLPSLRRRNARTSQYGERRRRSGR